MQNQPTSKLKTGLQLITEYGAYVLAVFIAIFGTWLIIKLLGVFGVLLMVGTMVLLVLLKIGFLFFLK